MRLVAVAVGASFMLALAIPVDAWAATEHPFSGSWTGHRYEAADPLDSRDYYLYVPSGLPDAPVPLVVYLHGCNQTALDAALGVRWNELADAEKFVVIYPEQFDPSQMDSGADQLDHHLFGGNGSQCWNWFRPDQIHRTDGEPSTIAGITRTVMDAYPIDAERVYLSGISAGGAMASVMGASYPDLYAAIAVLAGCGYQACSDAAGTAALAAMGQHARPLPVVVAHGTADTVAPYTLGLDALEQWRATNDLIDDGAANDSVPRTPATTDHVGVDATAFDGVGTIGDTCIRPSSVPCPGGLVGFDAYPHTIDTYVDAAGCELLQLWSIHGLQHAYSGGDPRGTFVDPLGPGETPIAWQFFQRHTLSGPTAEACGQQAAPSGPQDASSAPDMSNSTDRRTLPETGGGPAAVASLALVMASLYRRDRP